MTGLIRGFDDQPMPGRDGHRVPLRRFFDVQRDGAWGYLIDNCKVDGRADGFHVIYNYVSFPDAFSGKDKGGLGLHDMGFLMERNHEDNLKWLRANGQTGYRDWKELFGKHEGETLVIASCGPSLTHALPMLYRRRKEFRLMCLNRSMRAFMDPEVKPDYYYFVERRGLPDWVREVEWPSGTPKEPFDLKGITMIGTPQCDPRVVSLFDPERCYWGYTELGAMGHVPECAALTKYDVKAATTIGNAPFMAWKMGFKKLILVGCDFALDCQMSKHPEDEKKQIVEPTRMYFDKDWHNSHYARDGQWVQRMMPTVGNWNRACMSEPILTGHATYFEAVLDFAHHEGGMWCCNASARGNLRYNNLPLDAALDYQPEKENADGAASHVPASAVLAEGPAST